MEEDSEVFEHFEVPEVPAYRPDWFLPAALVFDVAADVTRAFSHCFNAFSNLMVSYSTHEDGRRAFHEEAVMQIETITTGEADA